MSDERDEYQSHTPEYWDRKIEHAFDKAFPPSEPARASD